MAARVCMFRAHGDDVRSRCDIGTISTPCIIRQCPPMAALRRTGAALNTSLCIALRSRTSHQFHTAATLHNSNRVSIGRSGRTTFLRSYPVLLVQPDGSTITVQYKEPRKMLIMPIDITTLSEEERKARLRQRNQSRRSGAKKEKDEYEEVILDEYSQFWRKK